MKIKKVKPVQDSNPQPRVCMPIRCKLECIAKWCLISQCVTTTLSKAVKQDDRSLV